MHDNFIAIIINLYDDHNFAIYTESTLSSELRRKKLIQKRLAQSPVRHDAIIFISYTDIIMLSSIILSVKVLCVELPNNLHSFSCSQRFMHITYRMYALESEPNLPAGSSKRTNNGR